MALILVSLLGCSPTATEVVPSGRFALVSYRNVAVPTPIAPTSPEEIVGGTLVLDSRRYELTLRYRARDDTTLAEVRRISRGRVSFVNGEFRLALDEVLEGPRLSDFMLMYLEGNDRVRVVGSLASGFEFERVR